MDTKSIGVIVGSLRRGSYSKAIAREISGRMPEDFRMVPVEIGSLPLFNQDFEEDGNTPAEYASFRRAIGGLDGFLFVTPEYNRSFPAVLKNALDVGSRPYGQNLWAGKPGAIVGVSPGKLSAFGASCHLRQVLAFLNVYTMQQPEAYIGNVDALLDENGSPKDSGAKEFLDSIAGAFAAWVRRFADEP